MDDIQNNNPSSAATALLNNEHNPDDDDSIFKGLNAIILQVSLNIHFLLSS